ncbi:CMGC family protein kinase [Histomonas meleagridis]|uniref:CMGC family protein kinase n=1 Tax=Histomonas meleagridis TaxID=135588 RepID=UPI00355A513F|nr:CMGC family protein kinase [Histomonas meleagridis]KAH0798912.1 CMGC family protein kinase [Histomonas meleagridis]
MCLLYNATLNLREVYNLVDPSAYAVTQYFCGRPLNIPEDCPDPENPISTDGHKIVCVNEIFEDPSHNQFRVIDVIGNGTFSYVFKCQMMNRDNVFTALKIIKNLPQYRATGVSEIMILKHLASSDYHPGKDHVVIPISTFEVDRHICMVMPLLSRSLFEGICQTQSTLNLLATIRNVMGQLLQALSFIHSRGVIHCDIKPDNILYLSENSDDISLIDFGSASTSARSQGQYIQSRFYRSFEVMMGLEYDSKIDIWSAGCVAAELFLDFAIFACESESDSIHTMVALLGDVPDYLISSSPNWWKFYDVTPQGFKLKMEPQQVLLTKHLYHSIFEQLNLFTLDQVIMAHCMITTEEELRAVACFSDFVHCLLRFDSTKRLSADEALRHPFITGQIGVPLQTVVPQVGGLSFNDGLQINTDNQHPILRMPIGDPISTSEFLSMM